MLFPSPVLHQQRSAVHRQHLPAIAGAPELSADGRTSHSHPQCVCVNQVALLLHRKPQRRQSSQQGDADLCTGLRSFCSPSKLMSWNENAFETRPSCRELPSQAILFVSSNLRLERGFVVGFGTEQCVQPGDACGYVISAQPPSGTRSGAVSMSDKPHTMHMDLAFAG